MKYASSDASRCGLGETLRRMQASDLRCGSPVAAADFGLNMNRHMSPSSKLVCAVLRCAVQSCTGSSDGQNLTAKES